MKYNIEDVKKIFVERGYIPLFYEYNNSKEKLDFMNRQGYKGSISLNKINNIDNYLYFAVFNKFIIDNINMYCKQNDLLCRVYKQKYMGINGCLKSKCLVCGKDFFTTWRIISDNRHNKYKKCCKICSNNFTHKNDMKKYSIEDVRAIFKNNNLVLLEDNYTNNTTKMLCEDKDGYKGYLTLHQLLSGNKFNKFYKSNPFSIDNVNVFFHNNKCNTIILDNIFKGNQFLYNFKCECGKIFTRSIDSVVYNHSLYCLDCSNSKKSKYHLKVKEYLDSKKIKYIEEKTFEGCKDIRKLPFDFYLPDYNACIEVQGEQHYKAKDNFGGLNGFEKQISHDIIKSYFCRNNNIIFIKIDYKNFFNNDYKYILTNSIRNNNFNKI